MLFLIACFAALGGFLFGYDLGLIAGALLYMEDDIGLTDDKEAVIVGMAKLGAVFGTFIGGGGALHSCVNVCRNRPWRRMRRVASEEDAASVHGCSGTL